MGAPPCASSLQTTPCRRPTAPADIFSGRSSLRQAACAAEGHMTAAHNPNAINPNASPGAARETTAGKPCDSKRGHSTNALSPVLPTTIFAALRTWTHSLRCLIPASTVERLFSHPDHLVRALRVDVR